MVDNAFTASNTLLPSGTVTGWLLMVRVMVIIGDPGA